MSICLSSLRRKAFNTYNLMPYPVKRFTSNFMRLVPAQLKFGNVFGTTLQWIKNTEYLSQAEIHSMQAELLKSTLINAWEKTTYYRRQMDALGIDREDIKNNPEAVLRQLPFIEKNMILENSDDFVSTDKNSIPHDYTSTGGTSGEPFHFYFDSSRSAKEWAYFTDLWGRIGFSLNSKRATFRGSKIHGDWEDDWATRERKYSSFNLTPEYLSSIWPSLNSFKPDFIYAYPSTAITLCRFMENGHIRLPDSVKGILMGSENVYEGQKPYIENISGKRAFVWYGHSEKLVLAGECETSSVYHAYPQYGYAEFITEDGQPAEPGEFCEIVGTGFLNTVMPFIRYRTGDYCIYRGNYCPECGRYYHLFSDISGRWTQELLYGKEGNAICMSAINIHSKNMHNIFRLQFHQKKQGEASLKVVPKKEFNNNDKILLEKEFNEKLNGSVSIDIELVKEIPLTARGKYKYIIQEIKKS
jgi:phenylacetate-CoA ligase